MIIAVFKRNLSNCEQKPEKVKTSMGFEPVTSRYRYDALTNWAMKPLTLGAGHLWVLRSPWRIDVKWYMKCFIYHMKCFILLDFKIRSSIYETFHISLHNKDYVIYISNPYFTGVDEPILWYELQNWVTQLWEKGARSSKKASFSINMEQSYHSY